MICVNDYEILAPCGSYASAIAAVNAGANSIYLGAKAYNARAYANNFTNEEIINVINYCHLRGVKVYITFNILYKQRELMPMLSLAALFYSKGADAFITADIGVFSVFKKYFPDIPINASTQMTVHNTDTAKAVQKLGASRIVLARELNLQDIKAIHSALGNTADIEAFVHGALCVCYSGRCLYSSFVGGRSGNRGQCAQPCRMEYTLLKNGKTAAKGALLSPKDIMTADNLYSLINAGVSAFKIEGRLKSPAYVTQTVKTYKKYLELSLSQNKNIPLEEEDEKNLLQVFNRGGSFSGSYYKADKGRSMLTNTVKNTGRKIGTVIWHNNKSCKIVFTQALHCGDGIEIANRRTGTNISKEIPQNKPALFYLKGKTGDTVYLSSDKHLTDSLNRTAKTESRKITVSAEFTAHFGKPTLLTLKWGKISVTAQAQPPQNALSKPLAPAEIQSRLSKTGNTPFVFNFVKTETDNDIYYPVSELNELRRTACQMLEQAIINNALRETPVLPAPPVISKTAKPAFLSAEVTTPEQLRAALNSPVKRIYVNNPSLAKPCEGKEIFYALPEIIREHYAKKIKSVVEELNKTPITGYLTRNLTNIKTDKKIICDHTLGVYNTFTAETLLNMYSGITLSTELSPGELVPLCGENTELIVYGRLPLMVTEQCPIGNFCANTNKRFCRLRHNKDNYALRDRVGEEYPIITDCNGCYAKILSSRPVFILNSPSEIRSLSPSSYRLIFTTETEQQTAELIQNHYNTLILGKNAAYPKGHYLKGVK